MIAVSVMCITYNQSKYIKRALDSILMQKTKFIYEVLIHDDASNDGTKEIVQAYAQSYPNRVRAVLQKENQYSKHVSVLYNYLLPIAKGKYFAICEGDDYWIDPYKLQKQYDYMESHPTCTLCVHNAIKVDRKDTFVANYTTTRISREIPCKRVVQSGGGFCVTNSIFAPLKLLKARPKYMKNNAFDYVLQTYLASCGTVYCFKERMSAYRINQPESWVGRMHKDREAYWKFRRELDDTMKQFDCFTHFQYHNEVLFACARGRISALATENRCKELLKPEYRRIWLSRKYPLRRKLGILRRLLFYFILKKQKDSGQNGI